MASNLLCHQSFLVGSWERVRRAPSLLVGRVGRDGPLCAAPTAGPSSLPYQTLCFRVRKMIDVYKPDWCEVREDWSVYLFSPENK